MNDSVGVWPTLSEVPVLYVTSKFYSSLLFCRNILVLSSKSKEPYFLSCRPDKKKANVLKSQELKAISAKVFFV